MANYSKCPLFPKPRKGSKTNTNNFSTVVDSIIRPNSTYAQATANKNTVANKNAQRITTLKRRNPATSQQNQANRIIVTPPIIQNFNPEAYGSAKKFFRRKRSNISNLNSSSGIANSDEQKANLLALTLKNNFIESKRPDDKIYPIDDNITNTLEDFLSHPPPLPIAPTNPDEIPDYVKRFPNNKVPGSDNITNKMSINQEAASQSPGLSTSRPKYLSIWDGGTFRVPFPKDAKLLVREDDS
ncbi:hypothetical protein TNCV_3234151 [Trichonephila clavipes]|nr:hypothetical protein TNCV_3234151 [Trichonephila clavipes]